LSAVPSTSQGQKYNKRWVEVTQDTLVYAGSQQEVLTGKIQVFAMHEMAWVKKEVENKFTVRAGVESNNHAVSSSIRR
jgi:hypothetical protein